ncbi:MULTISPECIES: TetR/AcrR family transcriptional regulator [unclassified Streptomyces]|uniref:TetR/AcrR family transcriptional regulator n=1 Tax=unclassified Streptomyces TaxID=2593676 RepID=UPI0037F1BFDA
MGHSQAEKAASRERVLRIAARKVRTDGVGGLGVADVMKEAGLTHGGFYKHFASRDDLVTQAAAAALTEGSAKMERAARKNERDARAGLLDAYLSEQHRDTPATGCALVPLGAAAGRDGTDGDVHLKDAYERQVRAYLDLIAGLDENAGDAEDAEDAEDARAEAVLTLSALVGAVLMSRAVADGDLSDEILETVNRRLKHRAGPRPAQA